MSYQRNAPQAIIATSRTDPLKNERLPFGGQHDAKALMRGVSSAQEPHLVALWTGAPYLTSCVDVKSQSCPTLCEPEGGTGFQRYMSLNGWLSTTIGRMIVTLQTERLRTVEQIRGFLDGSGEVGFRPADREEAYGFVRRTLVRLDYRTLDRAGKGTVRGFLMTATGLSRAVTRLVAQHPETGRIEDRRGANSGRPFERVHACSPDAQAIRPTD